MTTPIFVVALLFLSLPQISLSAGSPDEPANATEVCSSTLYPAYCTQVLREDSDQANLYEYGFFSLKRSIQQAKRFLTLVDNYLSKNEDRLTESDIHVLQDCWLLVDLNLDYLRDSLRTLSASNNKTLSGAKGDEVQALLSATLTNQLTCLESLNVTASGGWSYNAELSAPLSNDTKLHSVLLSIVSKGWIPEKNITRGSRSGRPESRSAFGHGGLPLNRLERTRQILESGGRRKLLADDDQLGVMVSGIVTVSQDGSGNFTTIMDAVATAPSNSDGTEGYFIIHVTAGVYEEYVSIAKTKKYILMIGDGINQTIITGNRSVLDGWTTFSSATVSVTGTGFVGVDLTIRNTAGAIKHQAVALRSNADHSTFYRISFEGYQDTLYTHSLRQFYRDCQISGTVDFIFGNAAAVLQNCEIYPRLPLTGQFNAITAQGRTDPYQNTGISLLNCKVVPANDLAGADTVKTYLGRPWKMYSRTVFMTSYLDGFIDPAGWREWSGSFALDTLYYGEFNNTGPGSDNATRVTWPGYHIMNSTDAESFTASNFLMGDTWLAKTGVPFFGGLSEII